VKDNSKNGKRGGEVRPPKTQTIGESFPADVVNRFFSANWQKVKGWLALQPADADAVVSEGMMRFLRAEYRPEYGTLIEQHLPLLIRICSRLARRLAARNTRLTVRSEADSEIPSEIERPDRIFENRECTQRLAELWRGKVRGTLGERLYGSIRELGSEEGCVQDDEFCAWAAQFFFVRKVPRRETPRKELMVRLGSKLGTKPDATYQMVCRARKRWRLAITPADWPGFMRCPERG
jgi:hypothetical protein